MYLHFFGINGVIINNNKYKKYYVKYVCHYVKYALHLQKKNYEIIK